MAADMVLCGSSMLAKLVKDLPMTTGYSIIVTGIADIVDEDNKDGEMKHPELDPGFSPSTPVDLELRSPCHQ